MGGTIKNIRIAVVIDNIQIVMPLIFKAKYPNIKFEAFSTMKAASEWVCR